MFWRRFDSFADEINQIKTNDNDFLKILLSWIQKYEKTKINAMNLLMWIRINDRNLRNWMIIRFIIYRKEFQFVVIECIIKSKIKNNRILKIIAE
jgi:hypothetical protein